MPSKDASTTCHQSIMIFATSLPCTSIPGRPGARGAALVSVGRLRRMPLYGHDGPYEDTKRSEGCRTQSRTQPVLRAAQHGAEIVIKDRDTPIARLLPYKKEEA